MLIVSNPGYVECELCDIFIGLKTIAIFFFFLNFHVVVVGANYHSPAIRLRFGGAL